MVRVWARARGSSVQCRCAATAWAPTQATHAPRCTHSSLAPGSSQPARRLPARPPTLRQANLVVSLKLEKAQARGPVVLSGLAINDGVESSTRSRSHSGGRVAEQVDEVGYRLGASRRAEWNSSATSGTKVQQMRCFSRVCRSRQPNPSLPTHLSVGQENILSWRL